MFVFLLSFNPSQQSLGCFLDFRVDFIDQRLRQALSLNLVECKILFNQTPVFANLFKQLLQCGVMRHSECFDVKFEFFVQFVTLNAYNVCCEYFDLYRINYPENSLRFNVARFVLCKSAQDIALVIFDRFILLS